MELIINDDVYIETIQEKFNRCFPFLKLEFFSKKHKKGEGTSKNNLQKAGSKIADCRKIKRSGVIKISGREKVAELEQMFQDSFGLSVQVFRKSGKVWLETTSTDDWTLEKQNEQAKELSKPINN